jgi:hypothetical protein
MSTDGKWHQMTRPYRETGQKPPDKKPPNNDEK